MVTKFLFLLMACLVLVVPAWSGHTLTAREQKVLESWLAHHLEYRIATDEDCDCADDIKQMKAGWGGASKQENNFALVVFNGPFKSETSSPAFMQSGLDLKYQGLVYGPPRPKPYRLLLGRFESDSGSLLIPHGRGYRLGD